MTRRERRLLKQHGIIKKKRPDRDGIVKDSDLEDEEKEKPAELQRNSSVATSAKSGMRIDTESNHNRSLSQLTKTPQSSTLSQASLRSEKKKTVGFE